MAQGFIAGALWGTLCGVALLGVASQGIERKSLSFPKPEASAVEVPGGSEFDQARPESEPVVPGVEPARSGSAIAVGVVPPEDLAETPPAFDTSSLEAPLPSVDSPAALGEVPDFQEDSEVVITGPGASGAGGGDSPSLPSPETPGAAPSTETGLEPRLDAPAADGAGSAAAPVADDAAPQVGDASAVPAPLTDTGGAATTDAPSAPSVDSGADVAALPAPDTSSAPDVTVGSAGVAPDTTAPTLGAVDGGLESSGLQAPEVSDAPVRESGASALDDAPQPDADDTPPSLPGAMPRVTVMEPAGEIGDLASNVTTNRLPRIGDDTENTTIFPSLNADSEEADVDAPVAPVGGALEANKVAFSNASDKPMLSVILVHSQGDAVDPEALQVLPQSVTFAVNAGDANAAEVAAAYRAAGREVVMIPNLPDGARPQDVEVALQANFERVPEAVAIMDASGGGFQSNRAAVAQVVDIVELSGHGLITFPRGLNTAHQRAERAGIPAGLIFRDIDGEGQTNDQIRRAFDRAAFRARQDEAVILVGTTRDETRQAIREWSLGNRAATVILAPVSAALTGG